MIVLHSVKSPPVRLTLCETVGMDLELLLADLSSRFDAQRREDLEALGAQLADAERVAVTLADRLAAVRGRRVTVLVRGGTRVQGVVVDVAREWLLVRGAGRIDSLIPLAAVVSVWPLVGVAPPVGRAVGAVGIGHALRELAELEVPVAVDHDAGIHHGLVVAVYADHFDLETRTLPRGEDSRDAGPVLPMAMTLDGVRRISVWRTGDDLSR